MLDRTLVEVPEQFVELSDPYTPGRRWRVDADFLASNWTCVWGAGCIGILDDPAEDLQQGCCSHGAEVLDQDEAMLIAALAASLDPARFQNHATASELGVFLNDGRTHTRVVNDACIFFNRPEFDGGVGCALHLGALDAEEQPTDWKPSICWQAPLKAHHTEEGTLVTLRPWTRDDWGPGGKDMAWICTDPNEPNPAAFVGDEPVVSSLAHELSELLGPELYGSVRAAIDQQTDGSVGRPAS